MTFSLIITFGKYGLLYFHHFCAFQPHEQTTASKQKNTAVSECYRPGLGEKKLLKLTFLITKTTKARESNLDKRCVKGKYNSVSSTLR